MTIVSPPSAKYSPYQEFIWPQVIRCRDQSGSNEEDNKRCDERIDGAMEPEPRRVVSHATLSRLS
jgi:hypothetical protein